MRPFRIRAPGCWCWRTTPDLAESAWVSPVAASYKFSKELTLYASVDAQYRSSFQCAVEHRGQPDAGFFQLDSGYVAGCRGVVRWQADG